MWLNTSIVVLPGSCGRDIGPVPRMFRNLDHCIVWSFASSVEYVMVIPSCSS
jgi:hypothetical protein